MERIEVLEGPQGTLFGAGAEAGVSLYHENKPKLNVTRARQRRLCDNRPRRPQHCSRRHDHVPVIADRLAVRAVIYNDARAATSAISREPSRGRATMWVSLTCSARNEWQPGRQPGYRAARQISINNNNLVGKGHQPGHLQGHSGSALFSANDDWSALLTQSYQTCAPKACFPETPVTLPRDSPCLTCQCSCTTPRSDMTVRKHRPHD